MLNPTTDLRNRWGRTLPLGSFVRLAESRDGVGHLVAFEQQTTHVVATDSATDPDLKLLV